MAKSRGSGGGRRGAAGAVGPLAPFFFESDMLKLHPHTKRRASVSSCIRHAARLPVNERARQEGRRASARNGADGVCGSTDGPVLCIGRLRVSTRHDVAFGGLWSSQYGLPLRGAELAGACTSPWAIGWLTNDAAKLYDVPGVCAVSDFQPRAFRNPSVTIRKRLCGGRRARRGTHPTGMPCSLYCVSLVPPYPVARPEAGAGAPPPVRSSRYESTPCAGERRYISYVPSARVFRAPAGGFGAFPEGSRTVDKATCRR